MKIFLDTANLDELKRAAEWGIVDGVTTNPSLIAKEGRPIEEQIARICDIVDGDISAEVVATKAAEMIPEGLRLSKIHKNVVVKLPLTRDGIKACSTLSKQGIRINVTLASLQVRRFWLQKPALNVSPFVGRLDDIGLGNGMELVQQIVQIYENYSYKTQILAASLRTPNHVIASAMAGAHIGTMPFKLSTRSSIIRLPTAAWSSSSAIGVKSSRTRPQHDR